MDADHILTVPCSKYLNEIKYLNKFKKKTQFTYKPWPSDDLIQSECNKYELQNID